MPNRHRVILPSLAALLGTSLYAGSAAASGDCEAETGRAKGMCQAYCEAIDCDGDPEASAEACETLESHFTSMTGRALPCEAVFEPPDVDCPCLEFYGWSGAFEPSVEGLSCWYDTSAAWEDPSIDFWATMVVGTMEVEDWENDMVYDVPICSTLEWWDPEGEAEEYEIVLETQEQVDGCMAWIAAFVDHEQMVCN